MRSVIAACLLVVLVVSAFLRVVYLDHYPDHVHHDQIITGVIAMDMTPATFVRDDGPMTMWTAAALRVSRNALWGLRVPAACAGVLLVVALYLLGRDLFTPQVGLIAAALATTNITLLCWSRLPHLLVPTPFLVLAGWCAVRRWWLVSGALAGYGMWAYWGAVPSALIVYAVCGACAVLTTGLRQWVLPFSVWGVGFGVTNPATWHRAGDGGASFVSHVAGKVQQMLAYSGEQFAAHGRAAFDSLYGGVDQAQVWGDFTHHALVLPVDLIGIGLCAAAAIHGDVSRPVVVSLVLAAAVVWVVCGVLPPDAGTHFHLLILPAIGCLLAAVGLAQLRWPPLVVAMTLAVCMTHLTLFVRATSATMICPTAAVARWLSNHQDAPGCVSLLRRTNDISWERSNHAAFYAMAIRSGVDVHDNRLECPTVLALPGVVVPETLVGRRSTVPTTDGPLAVWEEAAW